MMAKIWRLAIQMALATATARPAATAAARTTLALDWPIALAAFPYCAHCGVWRPPQATELRLEQTGVADAPMLGAVAAATVVPPFTTTVTP